MLGLRLNNSNNNNNRKNNNTQMFKVWQVGQSQEDCTRITTPNQTLRLCLKEEEKKTESVLSGRKRERERKRGKEGVKEVRKTNKKLRLRK